MAEAVNFSLMRHVKHCGNNGLGACVWLYKLGYGLCIIFFLLPPGLVCMVYLPNLINGQLQVELDTTSIHGPLALLPKEVIACYADAWELDRNCMHEASHNVGAARAGRGS